MMEKKYKTAVGAFALGGIALLALGVALLGSGRLFSNALEYVLYFDGSVSGLSTGAPVVFRGVPMGSVSRISLVANSRDSNVTIPVYIRIDDRSFVKSGGYTDLSEEQQREIIQRMIQRGLRARLQLQSLITGQYRVELDFYAGSPANFRSATPDMEIPTIPSPIDTLQTTLAHLPLEQMVDSLSLILQNVGQALQDNSLGEAIAAFRETFEEARAIVRSETLRTTAAQTAQHLAVASAAMGRELPETLNAFRDAMQRMAAAADQLKATAASAQAVLGRDAAAGNELRRLLKESTEAMRSLRALADMLERNPEALLKGKRGYR